MSRPVVTWIWGPKSSGKSQLAQRLAAERREASYDTAIVELGEGEQATVESMIARLPVHYLYITSDQPPSMADHHYRIQTTIPLRKAAA